MEKRTNKVCVFAINLDKRVDRKESLIEEFREREEFDLKIISAIAHEIGSYGLWLTLSLIIKQAVEKKLPYVIICEDDHQFTETYDCQDFDDAINAATELNADVLLGGVSWFNHAIQINKGLFWVDRFNATQFMIVFEKFYQKILGADFQKGDVADLKISTLSDEIFVTHPFMSVQKEFGYSDVTEKNEGAGVLSITFSNMNNILTHLDTVSRFYGLNIG